jgi:hypothetical protein
MKVVCLFVITFLMTFAVEAQVEKKGAIGASLSTFLNSQPYVVVVKISNPTVGFQYSIGTNPSHVRFGVVQQRGGMIPLCQSGFSLVDCPNSPVCTSGENRYTDRCVDNNVNASSSRTPNCNSISNILGFNFRSSIKQGPGNDLCYVWGTHDVANVVTLMERTSSTGFSDQPTPLPLGVVLSDLDKVNYHYNPYPNIGSRQLGQTKRLDCQFAAVTTSGFSVVTNGVWQKLGDGFGAGFRCGKVNYHPEMLISDCSKENYAPSNPNIVEATGKYITCNGGLSAQCPNGARDQCFFPGSSGTGDTFVDVRCQAGFATIIDDGLDKCATYTKGYVRLVD